LNCIPRQRETPTSRKISHRPRVSRNLDNSGVDFLGRESHAPVPVSRKKAGAQMCVIQRVKNSGTVVTSRLVGLTAGVPKKSRE
jgi:hypothetical protein